MKLLSSLNLKHLNAIGFTHTFALLLIVIGSGIFGTYELVASHADQLPPTMPTGYAGSARSSAGEPARHLTENTVTAATSTSEQYTSRNWDGYVTLPLESGSTQTFNTVTATWKQPAVKCKTAKSWTAFWVGLDGWENDTVEQGGSEAYCAAVGATATYSLWWEMYPTTSIQTMNTINAGDQVTANVVYNPANSTYKISVLDNTTSQSFTKNETCAAGLTCPRNSADVITEDVGDYGGDTYFPLADYGTMTYSKINVEDSNGNVGTVSNPTYWPNGSITEYNDGSTSGGPPQTMATVSALHLSGGSFDTSWKRSQ